MPFSTEDRELAFAVRQWLSKQKGSTEEAANLEVVEQCLTEAFGLEGDEGAKYNTGVELAAAYREAVTRSKSAVSAGSEAEPKGLQDFLTILSTKGYFNGLEKGTPAYEDRLAKAKAKFDQRNSPYAGMSAEDLKTKGNSQMMTGNYTEASQFYTKAIELDPSNAVYFANRAAAYTHMKNYAKAVQDGERAVTIDPNYSKAYSRLGTALFYEGEYRRAVQAYEKACELEPSNESYGQDLKAAKDKLLEVESGAGAGGAASPFGGAGGFPGLGNFGQFLNNPDFLRMAADVMSNPNFNTMIRSFADNMQTNNMDMGQMFSQLTANNPFAAAEGSENLTTPLGNLSRADLEEIQNSAEVRENPKIQAIMEECKTEGIAAMMKYMGDPEVMSVMSGLTTKLLSRMSRPGASGDGAAPPALQQ